MPSCDARSSCSARPPARPATSTSSGTTRPPPWPRASPAAVTGASGGSSSGCGGRAARSRSGGSRSTCGAGPTPWRPRACRWTGTSTATATEDEVLPWDHLTAGLHRDFLWADWQAALAAGRGAGLPVDAVLRLRSVHRVRHRTRRGVPGAAGRRQPGHRPGSRAWRCAARCTVPFGRRLRCRGAAMRLRVRYAKLGKVRFTSHRDTARIWERAMRKARLPVDHERRVHAPTAPQLRPRAADGGGVDRRVPRRRARRRGDRR